MRKYSAANPAGNRAPLLIAVMSLIEDARAEKLMAQRYPGLHGLWGRFHVATRANSGLGFAAIAARLARALHDPGYRDDSHGVCSHGSSPFNCFKIILLI